MKWTLKKANTLVVSKHQRIKELEKPIESEDLETINFVRCMHDMIWVMDNHEA
jgi:hypothetical protein